MLREQDSASEHGLRKGNAENPVTESMAGAWQPVTNTPPVDPMEELMARAAQFAKDKNPVQIGPSELVTNSEGFAPPTKSSEQELNTLNRIDEGNEVDDHLHEMQNGDTQSEVTQTNSAEQTEPAKNSKPANPQPDNVNDLSSEGEDMSKSNQSRSRSPRSHSRRSSWSKSGSDRSRSRSRNRMYRSRSRGSRRRRSRSRSRGSSCRSYSSSSIECWSDDTSSELDDVSAHPVRLTYMPSSYTMEISINRGSHFSLNNIYSRQYDILEGHWKRFCVLINKFSYSLFSQYIPAKKKYIFLDAEASL